MNASKYWVKPGSKVHLADIDTSGKTHFHEDK